MDQYQTLISDFTSQHLKFVEKLWSPLGKNFGINFFGYRRFLPDGSSLGIASQDTWNQYYAAHFLGTLIPLYEEEIQRVSANKEEVFFRVGKTRENCSYEQALGDQGLWNSFAIYLKNHNHIEGFYFTAEVKTPKDLNVYVNNLDPLKLFATHFSQKMAPLMDTAQKSDLYHPTIAKENYVQKSSKRTPQSVDDMIQSLNIEEFQLPVGGENVIISLREFQCLFLMSKGQTFKEIGKSLDLSPRTVESYINNLKSKTGTSSKSELIKLYFKSPYRNLAF